MAVHIHREQVKSDVNKMKNVENAESGKKVNGKSDAEGE